MLLMALLEGPAHGYEVIRRLEDRSGGQWRPSPGSVYPALQLLEEEGTLSAHDDGGKKVYELTETGRELAEQVAARRPAVPWDTEEGPAGSARGDLRSAIGQLHLAARQVAEVADQARVEQAVAIVNEARRKLYQLLAES
jgi:DNA-binding PadR family transcriptional regulator